MTYNILFVCKQNRLRSRIADAYFNKINKNKKIKTQSAGIFKGRPVNKKAIKILKKIGLNISGETKGISTELLRKQDLVVIVADNVPKSLFDERHIKKVIVWEIPDAKEGDLKTIMETLKLMINVRRLVKSLKKKTWTK